MYTSKKIAYEEDCSDQSGIILLHVLFPRFGIPLLIYSCHSSQTIFETLTQGHCTIIIYHSTIVIKSFEEMTVKQFIVR